MKTIKYIIITPVRNEEKYIENTLISVSKQSLLPVQWIIVNDGSTDNTEPIIKTYADENEFITLVNRENRGYRKAGGGVIESFYEGYKHIKTDDWHFLVKLDGDLSFNSDYFEKCFDEFEKMPQLGIGGGDIYHELNGGNLLLEKQPKFHVRGATKIYKNECWQAIGGLIKAPGWDTIDEVKANMLGWSTQSFSHLKLTHHRYTGAADGSWKNSVKNGRANYISGYHPFFMIAKCINRISTKPFLIGSIGLFYGYIWSYLKKTERINDKKLIKFLRQQQINLLLRRKTIWI
ncbi:MAG: glycosyltransferase [Candidatus Lokiarchaeota archaeon]|nr:glycosyltransferase [Candidatus Lokiarchaeota archaeon]